MASVSLNFNRNRYTFLRIPRSQSIDKVYIVFACSLKLMSFFPQAKEASLRALEASQNADSMSMGIKEKSGAALAKTQELNDKANDAENTVDNELQPQLDTSKAQVEDLGTKNKVTKQHVEGIIKKLDEMKDLGDETRAAVENATSTSKVAEDALASIDARFAKAFFGRFSGTQVS